MQTNRDYRLTPSRRACIVQFARAVYAEGGQGGCPKERKRELWRQLSGRLGSSDKATDKAVERAEKETCYAEEAKALDIAAGEKMMKCVDKAKAVAPYIWSRAEWIERVQRLAAEAEKETDALRALDILGKAQGYFAPEERKVDVSMNLDAIMEVIAETQTPLVAKKRVDNTPIAPTRAEE